MAATILECWGMQSPGFPKLESIVVGSAVTCTTAVGGPTVETGSSMLLPADKINFNHWESKKFTVDLTPTNYLSFGFWVYIHNVDITPGKSDIVLVQILRAGLKDLSLEVRAHASGHTLNLINAAGTSVSSALNVLNDNNWNWIEGYYFQPFADIFVNRVAALVDSSDFEGDISGDDQTSVRFVGQFEGGTPGPTNSIVYIGSGYFADNSLGQDDLLSFPLVGGKDFSCYSYRLGATSSKADESDVDGSGEALSAGALVDTADDDAGTSADYTGTGAATIGATWAMDTGSDSGPAPRWDKWETIIFGMKYAWATSRRGAPYSGRYGKKNLLSSAWATSSIAFATIHTSVFGLNGVGVFPLIPTENEVAALGWFVSSASSLTLGLREGYFFVFALTGQGNSSYLMGDNKVGSKRRLVGCGGGRVG